jgi:hypothetical protein
MREFVPDLFDSSKRHSATAPLAYGAMWGVGNSLAIFDSGDAHAPLLGASGGTVMMGEQASRHAR